MANANLSFRVQDNLYRLPKTAQLLADLTESPEQVAIRRIKWAFKQYRAENDIPSFNKFLLRAGIAALRNNTTIIDAVMVALENLANPR